MNGIELEQSRQKVLECVAGKDVLNIFNHERMGHFTSLEHIRAMLRVVKSFKVIYIAAKKEVDPRIVPFLADEKLELWFMPVDQFDFKSEVLVSDSDIFVSDGESGQYIRNASFADDIRLVADKFMPQAEQYRE